MFFPRSHGPAPFDSSDNMHAISGATQPLLVCPPLLWPVQQSAESWQAIYRLAYEQLVIAIAPSPFQRALEPSLN
jgi:hypothetical protein